MSVEVKTIGDGGQLSLGTEHAGQPAPEGESWLHTPENAAALDRAIDWAEQNPARESDLEELERKLMQWG